MQPGRDSPSQQHVQRLDFLPLVLSQSLQPHIPHPAGAHTLPGTCLFSLPLTGQLHNNGIEQLVAVLVSVKCVTRGNNPVYSVISEMYHWWYHGFVHVQN